MTALHLRYRLAAAILVSLLWGSLSSAQEEAEPSSLALRERLVPEHEITPLGDLVAFDLVHGSGAAQVRVERTWVGPADGDGHFGIGWSDSNLVRIRRVNDTAVIVTRGAALWFAATLAEDGRFASQAGHTITLTDQESIATTPSGQELTFDADGRLTLMQPKHGKPAEFTYSADGLLQEVILGPNNSLRYLYDGELVSRIEGPEGLQVELAYRDGRLVEVVNETRHRVRYRYADDGTLLAALDDFGNVTPVPDVASTVADNRSDDDPDSNVVDVDLEAIDAIQSSLPPTPKREHDESGRLISIERRGRSLEFGYDASGRLQTETGVDGVASWTYDEFGRIATAVEADGTRLTYTWSPHDKPLRIESSTGKWQTFEYNEHGDVIHAADSLGNSTDYTWDARGRLASTQPSVGVGESYSYDQDDNLLTIDYSNGQRIDHRYDADGRLVDASSSTGSYARRTYDESGRLIKRDVDGLVTTYEYDEQGRMVGVIDPIHGRKTFDYSREADNQTSLTWGPSTRTVRTNVWGEPIESVLSAGGSERISLTTYDDFGQVESVESPLGRFWSYRYDAAGRRVAVVGPAGQGTELEYDPSGRLSKIVRDGVDHRTYLYDGAGRLQMETSPAGIAAVYAWDKAGRLREVIEPDGKVKYEHDERGLVTSFGNQHYTIQQEHHPDGSLARRNYETAGMDLRFPQDNLGRAAGVSLNDVAVSYEYDEYSRVNSILLPGNTRIWILRDQAGRPTEIAFGDNARMGLTWDYRDRLASVGVSGGPQNLPSFLEQYEYDASDNLTYLQTIDQPARELTYDADDRLTSVTTEFASTSFEYDANDNVEAVVTDDGESVWELDDGGRPRFLGSQAVYVWDEGGNLISIDDERLQATNEFDEAGRLVHRTIGDYDWSFGYLPDGDRLWQEGPEGRTWYAYLPEGLVAIKDETGTPWLVVNLPGTDRPLALCGPGGATLFLVTDHLHSIRRVLDPMGQVLSSADYGAYGKILDNVGASPLAMYAGMVRDNHGLYYARRRYYDPALLRFISIDPWAGSHQFPASHNAYAYAANNPFRFRDPKGAAAERLNIFDLIEQANVPDVPDHGDVSIESLQQALEEKREALGRALDEWKEEVMGHDPSLGRRSAESWDRINNELSPKLQAAWSDKQAAGRALERAQVNAGNLARHVPDSSSGSGQPDTTPSTNNTLDNGGPRTNVVDDTRDTAPDRRPAVRADDPTRAQRVGAHDPTIDRNTNRPRRPREATPNDPTRSDTANPSDRTIDDGDQPRRQQRARSNDPTVAEGGNPNDRTLSERNQPRRQPNRRSNDRTLSDVNTNDPTLNEANRPPQNSARRAARTQRINSPDRPVAGGGANQLDDILAGRNAAGGIAPRRGVGPGAIAPRGIRPLGAGTRGRLLLRRGARRLFQLGLVGTGLGLLNLYDNAQTAREIYRAGRIYARQEQARYRRLANWDRQRRDFNQRWDNARELVESIWADRDNPNSQWVITPSVTLNSDGTVTTNPLDRDDLIRQAELNVLAGYPPLIGIARERGSTPPTDFKRALEQAKQALRTRDGLAKLIHEMANRHKRALAEAEAKLKLLEAGSSLDGEPKDFDALRNAVERLSKRIEEVKGQDRQARLAALAEEIGDVVADVCGQLTESTNRARDGLEPTPASARTAATRKGNAKYEELKKKLDEILKDTKLPLAELKQDIVEVTRRRSDLGDVSLLLEDDQDNFNYQFSLKAVRDKLAEAEGYWDESGQIEPLRDRADEQNVRFRELLIPWLRNPHAQALWDQRSWPERESLPEDQQPTLRVDEIKERLQKLDESLGDVPEDARDLLGTAKDKVDEANELLVKLRSEGYAQSQGLEENSQDDVRVLLARLRGCAGILEQGLTDDERTVTIAEHYSSVPDVYSALDPTNPFNKNEWTITATDEEGKPKNTDGSVTSEDPADGDRGQPQVASKPLVPVTPENPFRPQDFDIIAREDKQPTKPEAKYPFELARASLPPRPNRPEPIKHGEEIPSQSSPTPSKKPLPTKPATPIRPIKLVSVPDVRGLPVQKARELIAQAGLGPSFTLGSQAPNVPRQYHVYAQQPAPRARVLPGSGVRVVFYDKPATQLAESARVADSGSRSVLRTPQTGTKSPRVITPTPSTRTTPSTSKPTREIPSQPSRPANNTPGTRRPSSPKPTREIPSRPAAPAMITVPSVAGLPASEASRQIRAVGLKPKFKSGADAPSKTASYRVYDQSPSSGQRIAENSSVEVTIYGQYREPKIKVPDVSGLSWSRAASRLREAGLVPKRIRGNHAPSRSKESQVYRQTPRGGQSVDEGSSIDLTTYTEMEVASRPNPSRNEPTLSSNKPTLSSNKPTLSSNKPTRSVPSKVAVPFTYGKHVNEARKLIEDAGLKANVVFEGVHYVNDWQEQVYYTEPTPGKQTTRGATVLVKAYNRLDFAKGKLDGKWKCSCGAEWVFGVFPPKTHYTGNEANRVGTVWNRSITGSLKGRKFTFSWTSLYPKQTGGKSGTGEISFDAKFTKGNWRMTNERGQSWAGTMVKDEGHGTPRIAHPNKRQFDKAGINLSNRTGETLYLDVEYRSNKTGSWKWHTTRTTVRSGYRGPLKDGSGQTIAASSVKISTTGASGRRYGDLAKDLVTDGPYNAESMGMHNLNIERRVSR